jgi:beta-hydroxylase
LENALSTLLTPKFIIVYVFVAAALFVHFRGRDRHTLVKQLSDHSTVMAPLNSLM